MLYKTKIALLALLFPVTNLFGFQIQLEDFGKVKLKNGAVLKTRILDIDLRHNVTIGLPDSQQVIIAADQIYKIKAKGIRHFGGMPDPKGLMGSVSFGMLFGKSSESSGMRAGIAINGVFGYQFTNLIGLGLGAGVEFVNNLITTPLYLQFDGQMMDRRVSPIYNIDFGGVFAWYNDYGFKEFESVRGGWFLRPGFGVRFQSLSNSIYILVSYQVQTLTYESNSRWGRDFWPTNFGTKETRVMKNLKYTFGIKF